jgi:hypothetical protein
MHYLCLLPAQPFRDGCFNPLSPRPNERRDVYRDKVSRLDERLGFELPVAGDDVFECHAGMDFKRVLRDDRPFVYPHRDEMHGDACDLHAPFECLRARKTQQP